MDETSKLNNEKQEKLKEIIKKLHAGAQVNAVKKDFHKLIKKVSPDEIAKMEQSLIDEGLPVEDVQRLCEVHVEVFKGAVSRQKKISKIPGHPVHTFLLENKEAKKKIKAFKSVIKQLKKKPDSSEIFDKAKNDFNELNKIDIHYKRKENQLFPYLEKTGFTGPSKVMWGKHNEIRSMLKQTLQYLNDKSIKELQKSFDKVSSAISKMIFMEEKILFPTSLKRLTEHDWALIRKGENEIGYVWITPGNVWDSDIILQQSMEYKIEKLSSSNDRYSSDSLSLSQGKLNIDQINLLLKHLPFDITYVDENNKVCYYSDTDDRIFPRSPGIIGREVQNCHPHKSVHIVNKIIQGFKDKKNKSADFWIEMNNKTIFIRYFPIYDNSGNYKGVIEVTQDITDIKAIKGEKRLLEWE